MSKVLFCAAAALFGGFVGAFAPPEWRTDVSRYVVVAALYDGGQTADVSLVFRPYQRD
jgi:hypothetical protein